MRPSGGWTRYPWDNDPFWKWAWIADSQYVDTTNQVWIPSKGEFAGTPVSGCTFPSFAMDWGATNAGSLTFNGTTDLLEMIGAQVIASGLKEYTCMAAYQLLQTPSPAPLSGILVFTNNSNTVNLNGLIVSTVSDNNPISSTVIASNGTSTQGYIPIASADNNRHVISMARERATSPTLYLVRSGTYDGNNVIVGNLGNLDYTIRNAIYTRFTVGGSFGATKAFTNLKLRCVLMSDHNLSAGDKKADDSQMSAASYLSREAA